MFSHESNPIVQFFIGIDQGLTTCLSLNDGQTTTKNTHNYDLTSILKIMERRKKGSKGFRRAQSHRKNYINWSINQLNFTDLESLFLLVKIWL